MLARSSHQSITYDDSTESSTKAVAVSYEEFRIDEITKRKSDSNNVVKECTYVQCLYYIYVLIRILGAKL